MDTGKFHGIYFLEQTSTALSMGFDLFCILCTAKSAYFAVCFCFALVKLKMHP